MFLRIRSANRSTNSLSLLGLVYLVLAICDELGEKSDMLAPCSSHWSDRRLAKFNTSSTILIEWG